MACLVLLAGCGSADAPQSPTRTLAASPECPDVVLQPSGDVAVLVAFGWDAGLHRWGETVEVRVCLSGVNGSAAFAPLGGVRVEPAALVTTPGARNVLRFQVTVDPAAAGVLEMRVTRDDGRIAGGGPGPTITIDGDGWRFVRVPQPR